MKFHLRNTLGLLAATGLTLAAVGCSALGLDGGTTERARLRANRAKWESHSLDAYRFTYQVHCFCETTQAITIDVEHAAVVRAGYASTDEPLPFDVQSRMPTVESLFTIVAQAIASRADLLEVTYDPVFGYPTQISVDRDFNTADDEFVHTASGLTPIGTTAASR